MNKIAIIPARSGSKGLKNKNIIDLCGKPLIAYTIESAIKSKQFSSVIVSTDSKKYATISQRFGAKVYMRSKELASDTASSFDVINDVINKYDKKLDYFVLLQPTSPLRNERHIKEAMKLFESKNDEFDYLVSVVEAEHVADLVKPIENDLSLKHFNKNFSKYHRQNHKEYSPNGAIFIGKVKEYLKRKHFFGAKSIAYIMNKKDSIDIDDALDLELARCIINKGRS